MKCTTCGYETQPGAKFCVQCGTTIVAASAPAGMAPLAAPSVASRPASAPAASSTSATAARPAYAPSPASATAARPAYAPSPATATAARPAYTPPPAATPDPGAVAAAPASSMRLGLIAGLLALIAAVGIGSFIAYKMLIAAPPKEPVTATETPKPVERPTMAPAGGCIEGCRRTRKRGRRCADEQHVGAADACGDAFAGQHHGNRHAAARCVEDRDGRRSDTEIRRGVGSDQGGRACKS